ncbi:NBS resistance-like protein [Theobroma cacao]|uniref:NBS resistance-like protein n=1 Tax=Theobroma cacao TaxID=3641 RepID=A0A061GRP0_THECC|nr:NBS resistance-like protein [Theobroma cacao]
MAEVAVSIVIALFDEKSELLRVLHKEVEDIKVELEFIASFLKEADARASKADHTDSVLKTWVKYVREAAFQIEDIVDEYMLHLEEHRDQRGCMASFQRIARLIKNLKKRHGIASRIQDMKRLVLELGRKRERYGFNLLEQGERSRSGAENNTMRDPRSYKPKEFLKSMIKQFFEARKEPPLTGIEAMEESMLISISRAFLKEKRYLMVFDDVWKEIFWLEVEYASMDNNKGSRIMITTRNVQAAKFCKKSSLAHVHELKSLSPRSAQQLLCKIASQFDQEKQCSLGLESVFRHYQKV